MATVKFAMICDTEGCNRRSPEYGVWCSCKECGNDTCDECAVPETIDHETCSCVCKACSDDLRAEFEAMAKEEAKLFGQSS